MYFQRVGEICFHISQKYVYVICIDVYYVGIRVIVIIQTDPRVIWRSRGLLYDFTSFVSLKSLAQVQRGVTQTVLVIKSLAKIAVFPTCSV